MPGECATEQLGWGEYEQLRRATETYRAELLLRLCGEAGLRAGEIARLRPADVSQSKEGEAFVTVREADGETRTGYLPDSVAHDFWQYVRSASVEDDQPVFQVSERRLQMLVSEIGERAAERTGRPALSSVTPTALRRLFARRLLVEDGVDARVVAATGGWEGVDGLLDGLDAPNRAAIAAAFDSLDEDESPSGRLRKSVDALAAVGQRIATEQSREAVERAVCETLAGEYSDAAWIVDRDPRRDRVAVRQHAGGEPERFEAGGETAVIRRALDGDRGLAVSGGAEPGPDTKGRLAAVALHHGETGYGALVVEAAGAAFEEAERAVLSTLGQQVAVSITALERKHILLGGDVLDVAFTYEDETPLVALSRALDRTLALDAVVADEAGLLCFVRVAGAETQSTLEAAGETAGLRDVRLIRSDDEGVTVELRLEGSPLSMLAEHGATITDLTVGDVATVACELSPEADLRAIRDDLRTQFPSVELHSKRERTVTSEDSGPRSTLAEDLTDRQRSVLLAAYHAGYFQWPRESTAEDLAESMDVSAPTFHNHLRKAQQTLLSEIIEEE